MKRTELYYNRINLSLLYLDLDFLRFRQNALIRGRRGQVGSQVETGRIYWSRIGEKNREKRKQKWNQVFISRYDVYPPDHYYKYWYLGRYFCCIQKSPYSNHIEYINILLIHIFYCKLENWVSVTREVLLPFLSAGLGMVGAGLVLER